MSIKKSGLGKGLGALIPSESKSRQDVSLNDAGDLIKDLELDLIIPNKEQPRKIFDHEGIVSLGESIKEHGLLQPIVVKPTNGYFQIIAGERRWRACKHVGLPKIQAIIKDVDAFTMAQFALIENVQRENLNPIEEAQALQKLIEDYNITQDKLSKIVGKSRSHLTNTLRLLKLDHYIQESIMKGLISNGHGRALLSLDNEIQRKNVYDYVIKSSLSVRNTEDVVKNYDKVFNKPIRKTTPKTKLREIVHIEDELSNSFGTKVRINEINGKGKITIDFYNIDDLNRILELINHE